MPLRLPNATFGVWLTLMIGVLIVAFSDRVAEAQNCPPAPDPETTCWTPCGECRGDLSRDGLLDDIDLLVFELYREQQPQNPCANFNGDCDVLGFPLVNEFDRQILLCLINQSSGACETETDKSGNPVYTCGETPRDCLVEGAPGGNESRGCNNPVCCVAVCNAAPFCCDVLWDAACVNIAANICYPDEPDTRADAGNCLCEHTFDDVPLDCLTEHGLPGCSDGTCSSLVCDCDPLCCRVTWDESCVQTAIRLCAQPCTNVRLSDMVCETLPTCCLSGEWDQQCTGMAALIIIQNPGLQIRSFPSQCLLCPVDERHIDPACESAVFRSLICLIDPFYCDETVFDTNVVDCAERVYLLKPECGEVWDDHCAQIASRLCRWPEPGTRGLGNCLLPSDVGRGCEDAYCSSLVCECDPNCCDVLWDQTCVNLAAQFCVLVPAVDLAIEDTVLPGGTIIFNPETGLGCGSQSTGSCLYQNYSPFCEDAACCQLVCGWDAFCCENRWDTLCARLATQVCDIAGKGVCGSVGPNEGYPLPSGGNYRSCFVQRNVGFCDGYPDCSPAGCDNPECCNNVCYVDPFCCEIRWDQICAEGAEVLCPQEFPECGTIISGSCFIPHDMPFCDDGRCCENVCIIEPLCCNVEWDVICVKLAETECTQCGDVYSGSCLVAHPAPACYDAECCELVCELDSFCCSFSWDSSCATLALSNPVECGRTDACGSPESRPCFISSYFPGCSDELCCIEICKSYDPWCCEVRWDAVCAAEALSLCEPDFLIEGRSPCDEWHATPGCNIPRCSAAVCSVPGLESCCTARWDTQCVEAADWLCQGIYECPGTGDCMRTNDSPLCQDPSCCNIVCTYDPLCCRDVWDNDCAVLAITTCGVPDSEPDWNCPCLGDCFEAATEENPSPGCKDESCCGAVCAVSPDCCTISWDETCVELAVQYCGGGIQCGSWTAGSCLEPGESPFCSDPACCQAVCTIEPYCCSQAWDSFCVSYAMARCRRGCGLETAGTCFYPKLTPGCNDAECCEMICDDDPICCANVWDGYCAENAIELCTPPECGEYAAGECCEINESPSCNDERCCDAVCGTDPFCCDFTWDIGCVNLARLEPTRCGCSFDCGDPCAGECCEPNFTPSCNEEVCCNAVCEEDPFCCEEMWDFTCANQATATPQCNDITINRDAPCPLAGCGDPGAGSCCVPNGTPGCSDDDCCDQICQRDPACCDVSWDNFCSDAAADPSTGCDVCDDPGQTCGSSATGDCCEAHQTPFCNDYNCCETVCLFDELCCIGTWDELCVALAFQYCPQCGGGGGGFAPPK